MKKRGNQKLVTVIGPTASGKTSLAIKVAKKFNGELINTDSRQIYKYLDIGTAKGPVTKSRNKKLEIRDKFKIRKPKIETLDIHAIEDVPIHLINIVEPDQVLTLAQYQKLAYAVIEDILKRDKLPILVGGTGLYIDAIIKGYKIPKIPPLDKLRRELNSLQLSSLQARLRKLDRRKFASLNNSDRNNPRRLIRLIEIALAQKQKAKSQSFSFTQDKEPRAMSQIFDVLYLAPKRSREELYERINKRTKLIVNSGLIEEVKNLIKKGYDFSKPAMTAISYPIVKKYLDGEITKEELIEQFAQGDRNYARRQVTWFKRYSAVEVVSDEQVFEVVEKFLCKK